MQHFFSFFFVAEGLFVFCLYLMHKRSDNQHSDHFVQRMDISLMLLWLVRRRNLSNKLFNLVALSLIGKIYCVKDKIYFWR